MIWFILVLIFSFVIGLIHLLTVAKMVDYRKALLFYADEKIYKTKNFNYHLSNDEIKASTYIVIDEDGGRLAREVLGIEEKKK